MSTVDKQPIKPIIPPPLTKTQKLVRFVKWTTEGVKEFYRKHPYICAGIAAGAGALTYLTVSEIRQARSEIRLFESMAAARIDQNIQQANGDQELLNRLNIAAINEFYERFPIQRDPWVRVRDRIVKIMPVIKDLLSGALSLKFVMMQASLAMPQTIDLRAPHRNLTRKAKQGQLKPITGRDQVLREIAAALTCTDKSNVVLVGPAGVGKTAIAEGLAQLLAQNPDALPLALKNCQLIEIKTLEFISNSSFLGQFETKMNKFIEDIENSPDLILFIDEIHALTTLNSGSSNARDMLKPMLARGKVRIIGCTTDKEVEMLVADGAFNRRFQRIDIKEPKGDNLFTIVKTGTQKYANNHRCDYPLEIVRHAIRESESLLGHQPDKALTVLDRAGARASMQGRKEVSPEDVDTAVQSMKPKDHMPDAVRNMYV